MRALIIGGSVGGLAAACLLHRAGWEVAVFERAAGDLAGRGAGLAVSAELVAIMERAGARFEASAAIVQPKLAWMAPDGRVLFEHPRQMVASAWARIYQPLKAALPPRIYRRGMTLEHLEQDERSVTAIFAGGARETADLLVAADGAHSTARRQLAPQVEPRFADYVAWRGLVPERELPPATLEALRGRIVFCFPPGEMLLCMAVPDGAYFIWYRGGGRPVRELFTDAQGRDHGMSIPPPLIRPEVVQALRREAGELLPGPVATVVERAAQPLLQAISDMESARLVFGRVALLGDAAFLVRPHVAGGASKAAIDAACLADALARHPLPEALAHYEARQRDFGSRLVRHSRYLGADLEGRPTERDPRRIMRDYGAPQLLTEVPPERFASPPA
ncbi:MAG TPA: FAD-dependent monooxygenase [Burkholderiales bacterium]|nr:FAD-dependent monooxygenase [Burkholderiales bacterium]